MGQTRVIAIDGPAASGKTTVGEMLAAELGFLFLDTGCMYRAATLAALRQRIDLTDEAAVVAVTQTMEMDILPVDPVIDDGRAYTVLLDGHDVTWEIRTPAVDQNVSKVSSYLAVRQEMVARQRAIAKDRSVVMVGRDIGTVVLPQAPLKLYIVASASERARRRLADRIAQGVATQEDFDIILADIERRDTIDSSREHSPLQPADDAIMIDTSSITPAEVVDQILSLHPLGD